jgi:hypothetical protein
MKQDVTIVNDTTGTYNGMHGYYNYKMRSQQPDGLPNHPEKYGWVGTITPQQVVEQLSLEDRSLFSIPKFSWP